jgi:hypothetical protein
VVLDVQAGQPYDAAAVGCASAAIAGYEMRLQRLWWCLPAAVLCAADGLLTLWGQPEAYWSGDFAKAREGHPVAAWFLTRHPLLFAAAGVPYLLLVAVAVMRLPRRVAAVLAAGVAAGHAFAVAAWCWTLFREPLLVLVPAALVVVGFAVFAWRRGRAGDAERKGQENRVSCSPALREDAG